METKTKTLIGAGVVVIAAAGIYLSGWNPIDQADAGAKKGRTVTANIAEFDPSADMEFDMDKWGSEMPDEYAVQQAFSNSFTAMDECVWNYKEQKGMTDKTLAGDVKMSVKLNPKKSDPMGINVEMPAKFAKKDKLAKCIRDAAADAPFPTYDGPPYVVNFEFELDAGSEWVEE